MTAVITHSVSAGGVVDPTAAVDGAAWDANHVITGVMSPSQGGTGIANNDSSTITVTGAFGTTFTVTATTDLTLPTTGTLATLAGSEALTNKTYNGNTWTAGTGTLTLGAGKTLTASNTVTFTATDGSSVALGAGGTVLYNGGALGTPSSGTLTNCTGLPISTGLTGAGTGVLAALAVNVGSAGAFVTFNGALGTPSSGTLTNATGLPVSSGISGLGANVATFLATPSSANLRAALTDESGTGVAYFQGGALGTPSSGTLTNATGLPISSGVSGLGTGIATALAVNTGSAGAPVLFNGALGTPSSGTLTNATGLPLSGLTTQGAYTIVANNSGSTAVPTAVDIAALTTKATPAAGDYLLLSDQAASGAFKKVTVSSVGASSGVSSLGGLTGAVGLGNGLSTSGNNVILNSGVFNVDRNGTNQTGLTAGTNNKISFTNEVKDANGWFDNATNFRYTPLVAGTYQICLSVGTNTGTSGETSQAVIYKNGSPIKLSNYQSTSTAVGWNTEVVAYVTMNGSTDYIEGYVYLPAAVTTLLGATDKTFMCGHRVGD